MKEEARVWIFMGSESDRPIMAKATEVLKEFGVGSRLCVASAHRSPGYLGRLLKEAEDEADVFIAGAGGAAHLAGVVASHGVKPVIGVPISTKMGGLDSLLSTVQMPRGVPVATVAVDGASNAALLALQIIGVSDAPIRRKLKEYRERQAREIEAAAA
jgi:5-(carboxyamino)imidazole ribonucleotide mutase